MDCAAHSGIEARGPCAVCFKNLCDACGTYHLDGAICCERCGRAKEDEGNALSSGLLASIGVGYLAALAIGVMIWKARPFVGGLAAIVAIALGRIMQLVVKTPLVTRRVPTAPAAAPAVDATPPSL
jgi:hypothetical protein